MATRNLYNIHFDLTVQNQRNHRKMTWDDKKTVVANGDAVKAVQKLRRSLLKEPATRDGNDRYLNVDVKVRSVDLVAKVDYA